MASNYYTCVSCGKYFSESIANDKTKYCSFDCESKYVRCIICGDYYENEGNVSPEKYICSKDCAKKHKLKHIKDSSKLDFSDLKLDKL
jgi:hypothetical protein